MTRPRLPVLLGAAAALALVAAVLVQPDRPGPLAPGALLPLELPLILVLLVAAPPRLRGPLRALLTLLLAAMAVLKLADLGVQVAYGRPFNPMLDGELLPAAWRLGSGAVGTPLALAAAAALVAGLALLAAALWWATGRLARLAPAHPRWLGALALPLAALVVLGARPQPPLPLAADTSRIAWEHARDAWAARADLARFRAEAARDPFAALPAQAILPALRGTDVFVVFVESYGRSALTNPLYAPTVTAALRDGEAALAAQGLAMRSAFLTAPMVGGQSWLAHASLLSGLWIDNQGRYRALLASPRRTLLHYAREAGWQTAAVMPAITLAWPEADYFGYDRILAAADLGYRGLPFNWVTMPDQFTLAAFQRQLLDPAPRPPVFAEIALISSHAPWTPIPPLLPWDALGDGAVFDRYATAGDPPDIVWRDNDRIRDQYRQSLDYTLRTVTELRRPPLGAPAALRDPRRPPARRLRLRRPGRPRRPGPPRRRPRNPRRISTPGASPRASSPAPTRRSGAWTPSATASSRPSAPRPGSAPPRPPEPPPFTHARRLLLSFRGKAAKAGLGETDAARRSDRRGLGSPPGTPRRPSRAPRRALVRRRPRRLVALCPARRRRQRRALSLRPGRPVARRPHRHRLRRRHRDLRPRRPPPPTPLPGAGRRRPRRRPHRARRRSAPHRAPGPRPQPRPRRDRPERPPPRRRAGPRRRRRAPAGDPGRRHPAAARRRGRPPPRRRRLDRPRRHPRALAARGLLRLLIEGGGKTIAGFLDAGLLQRLHVAIAPLIIGAGPSGLRSSAPALRLADALRPETFVYGLSSDVIFDCALAPAGNAITSTWPTEQRSAPRAARA